MMKYALQDPAFVAALDEMQRTANFDNARADFYEWFRLQTWPAIAKLNDALQAGFVSRGYHGKLEAVIKKSEMNKYGKYIDFGSPVEILEGKRKVAKAVKKAMDAISGLAKNHDIRK